MKLLRVMSKAHVLLDEMIKVSSERRIEQVQTLHVGFLCALGEHLIYTRLNIRKLAKAGNPDARVLKLQVK